MTTPPTAFFPFIDVDTFEVTKVAIPAFREEMGETFATEYVFFNQIRRMFAAGLLCDMTNERARQSMDALVGAYTKREDENPYHPNILLNSYVPLGCTSDIMGRWKQISYVHEKYPTKVTNGTTMQFLPAPYRHSVLKALDYVDVDVVACRASLLNYFLQNCTDGHFEQHEKRFFTAFIADKTAIFESIVQELSESWTYENPEHPTRIMTVDDVKTMFTAALNGKPLKMSLESLRNGRVIERHFDATTGGFTSYESTGHLPVRMHPLDEQLMPSLNAAIQLDYRNWKKMVRFISIANRIRTKIADNNDHSITHWLDIAELDIRKAELYYDRNDGQQISVEEVYAKRRVCLVDKIIMTMEHYAVWKILKEARTEANTIYFNLREIVWGWDGAAVKLSNMALKDAFLSRINEVASGSCLVFKYKEFDCAVPEYVETMRRTFRHISEEEVVGIAEKIDTLASSRHTAHCAQVKMLEQHGLQELEEEVERQLHVPIDPAIPLHDINKLIKGNQAITAHFNHYVKKVDSFFVEFLYLDNEQTLLSPREHKVQQLETKFANLYYYSLEEKTVVVEDGNKKRKIVVKGYKRKLFIKEWLKDPALHTYSQLDKFPKGALPLKPNSLNTWVGYRFENRILEEADYMPGAVDRWLELCNLVCNDHQGLVNKLNQSIASKIQNPHHRLPYVILFLGPQGSGKGTIVKTVQQIFGSHQACLLSDPDRDVFGDKSTTIADYDILLFDDVSPKTFHNVDSNGRIQNGNRNALITAEEVSVRPLYCNPYQIRVYTFIMACADDINVMPPNQPRRFLPIMPSDRKAGDKEYWVDYDEQWYRNPWYFQTIYSYLSKLSLEGFQRNSNLVEGNPANLAMLPKTLDPPMRFMMWLYQTTAFVTENPSFTKIDDKNGALFCNPYHWKTLTLLTDSSKTTKRLFDSCTGTTTTTPSSVDSRTEGEQWVFEMDALHYQKCHVPMTSAKWRNQVAILFFPGEGKSTRQVFIKTDDFATLIREYQEQDNCQLARSVNNAGGMSNHFSNSSEFKLHVKGVARTVHSGSGGEAERKTGILINLRKFEEFYNKIYQE